MQNVAIIVCNKPADWVSCRAITRNLAESYSLVSGFTFDFVELTSQAGLFEMCRVASFLHEKQFNKIIFIEHVPNPCPLVKALYEIDPSYQPELIFHAFGDFILNAPIWLQSETILAHYPTQFVCASKKQSQLLRSLVNCDKDQIVTIPFPVSVTDYYHDDRLRTEFRNRNRFTEDQTVFLYSGRLSTQKNIFLLLQAFAAYQRQIQPQAILCLAGPVDDLGIPYLGKRSPMGLMAYDIQNLIKEIYPEGTNSIRYLGDLDSKLLNEVYNAADVFVSLSSHNDEDFGMAPAEALATGLYSILSDWGGYSQFHDFAPDNCVLVPMHFQTKKVVPSVFQVTKYMATAGKQETKIRGYKAKKFQALISKQAVTHVISENLKLQAAKTGIKFTPLFKKVAQSFTVQPQSPFSVGENYSKLYQEVYDVYRS